MTDFLKLAGASVAGAVIALLFVPQGMSFGGTYNQTVKYFSQGFAAGESDEFAVDADGDLLTEGTIRSDRSTFCLDFYATSTATRVRMTASSTATIEGTDGVMVASYGACP
jgi:hypothetical protein